MTTTRDALSSGGEQSERRKYEMRLNLPQVIVLWSVIAGTMVMVFLFGLYAGQEQGVRAALEDRGETFDAVRLPVSGAPADAAALGSSGSGGGGSGSGGPANSGVGNSGDARPGSVAAPAAAAPAVSAPSALVPHLPEGQDPVIPAPDTRAPVVPPSEARPGNNRPATGAETASTKTVAEGANEVAPPPALRAEESSLGRGWYLQVAAARTKAEASEIEKKLERAKLAPKLEEAHVGANTYYRIVLGPYADKEQALSHRAAVAASGAVKGEPFLKNVR